MHCSRKKSVWSFFSWWKGSSGQTETFFFDNGQENTETILKTTRECSPKSQESKRVINLQTGLLLRSQKNHLPCTIFLLTLQGKLIKLSISIKFWRLMFPFSEMLQTGLKVQQPVFFLFFFFKSPLALGSRASGTFECVLSCSPWHRSLWDGVLTKGGKVKTFLKFFAGELAELSWT